MRSIVVEGWRGISHSFAMVNQYQILEWSKFPELCLYHHDVPYFRDKWANPKNNPGFPAEVQNSIMNIARPGDDGEFDSVYRIAYPFTKASTPAKHVVTFMVTEFGLSSSDLGGADSGIEHFCEGTNLVVTPSNWSRMKLLEYGFPANRVERVPHGVNSQIFYPLTKEERAAFRTALDVTDDNFLFLNVGALTDNKGIHLLLFAFSVIRQRHQEARLILKDSSGLYRKTVSQYIEDYAKVNPALPPEVLDSIFEVSETLSASHLRLLYGGADMYVSPYLAEGFNLPVIEAIACGTPAVVTAGGATSDFCNDAIALPVEAQLQLNIEYKYPGTGYHLQPDIDSLIEQMEQALRSRMATKETFAVGRQKLVEQFSWKSAVDRLNFLLNLT